MKRYYKMIPKYGDGVGFNSMSNSEKGSLYSLAGNTAGNLIEGQQEPYTLQDSGLNQGRMIGSNMLRYGSKGAAIGSTFGVAGTAIGAGVGAIGGALLGNRDFKNQTKDYNTWKTNQLENITQRGISNYNTNIAMGFKPMGNRYATFGSGGTVKPLVIKDPVEYKRRKQAYDDSLDVYNLSTKLNRYYPNTPQISKEEHDRLIKKRKSLPNYEFDTEKYETDKKNNKPINTFEDYIYSAPDSAIYNHPRYKVNGEYGVKNRGERDVDKYTNDETDKFAITLKDGSIKRPQVLYDGKPEWDYYNITSPDGNTTRMYYKDFDGKPKLSRIYADKIKPIRTDYYGKDELIKLGSINTSSSSTGWYKEGQKPKFKQTSKKSFTDYSIPVEDVEIYKKPVQPIIKGEQPVVKPKVDIKPKLYQEHLMTSKDWQDVNTNDYKSEEAKIKNIDTNKFDIYRTSNGTFDIRPKPIVNNQIVNKPTSRIDDAPVIPPQREVIKEEVKQQPIIDNSPKFRIQGAGTDMKLGLDAQKQYSKEEIQNAAKSKGLDKDIKFNKNMAYFAFGGKLSKFPEGGNMLEAPKSTTFTPLNPRAKKLYNSDGSISTESIFGITDDDGKFYNIPSVIDGKRYSFDEAYKIFKQTGNHTGMYNTQEEADKAAESREKANIGLGSTGLYKKGGKLPRYAKGGFTPEYEVEKSEVIQGSNVKLSDGGQVSGDMHLAEGVTHDEVNPTTGTTGVLGAGGDRVFSNRSTLLPETIQMLKALKVPVNKNDTHAKVALTVAKKESKFQDKVHSVSLRERNSSNQMLQRYSTVKDIIFQDQEIQKPQEEQMTKTTPQFAKGGKLPRYTVGGTPEGDAPSIYKGNNKDATIHFQNWLVSKYPNALNGITERGNWGKLTDAAYNNEKYHLDYYNDPNGADAFESNVISQNDDKVSYMKPMEVKSGYDKRFGNNTPTQINIPNNISTTVQPKIEPKSTTTAQIKGGDGSNDNSRDMWGTTANTLNLVNNLISVNKLKSFNNPEMPIAPVMRYNSNLPYNIYENAKAGRTALKNMNRYGANPNNKYAVTSSVIEGNNKAFAEDNMRRGDFNNQVSMVKNQIDNQGVQIRNAVNQGKIDLNNTKVTERNNAINVWATGEMQNKYHNDQIKLEKRGQDLIYGNKDFYKKFSTKALKDEMDAIANKNDPKYKLYEAEYNNRPDKE